MRRAGGLLVVAALTVAIALLTFARPGADAGAKPAPRLAVVDRAPVTVRGSAFHARERLRVEVAMSGARWVQRLRTTRAGTFVASFPGATAARCSTFVVRAIGAAGTRAAGTRASARSAPRTACRALPKPRPLPAPAAPGPASRAGPVR